MSNMNYCQFENTYHDLRQCYDAMYDEVSLEEEAYKKKILALCKKIVEEFSEDIED